MPPRQNPSPFVSSLLRHRISPTIEIAIERLAELLPKPHGFCSWAGFNRRKIRLGVELAEFDLLHRVNRGHPPDLDVLCKVSELIIASVTRTPSPSAIPLDEPLIVTSLNFETLMRLCDAAMDRQLRGSDGVDP